MICPRCKGKTRVVDTVKNPDDNEIYRRRRCDTCGYEFYTTETKSIRNFVFNDAWLKYHRRHKK